MSTIYIRNHDRHSMILAYQPETGTYQELQRSALPTNATETRGFYVRVDAAVVGVYASAEGPICFYNQQRFRLNDPACQVALQQQGDTNIFVLQLNQQEQFRVRYRPSPYHDYDPWSEGAESADFFAWLVKSSTNPKFYTFHTI